LLTRLNIQNYALIEDVQVIFSKGLTTITGETGAGKSILLGGLGLILGNRADAGAMRIADKKCIIEGEFDITLYHLRNFFEENDIDYDKQTVIRREILPGGKSRAFINDTPVRLEVISELQSKLIDVHSQHQTLRINEPSFQYAVVDAWSDNQAIFIVYLRQKTAYEKLNAAYDALVAQLAKEKQESEYHYHLYRELHLADIKKGELQELEVLQDKLSHIDLIQNSLSESYRAISEEQWGINPRLYQVKNQLEKIKSFSSVYDDLFNRVQSSYIELSDMEREIASILDKEQYTPDQLENVNQRLQVYYTMMQKHHVNSEDDLLKRYTVLEEKVKRISDSDQILKEKKEELYNSQIELSKIADLLFENRKKHIPQFENEINEILYKLGIKEAAFEVKLLPADKFNSYGADMMQWWFSANKGNPKGMVSKVASGGELSRIMMAIKSVLAKKTKLPTIIFDEIDTGISGEVALQMGEIMKTMAHDMQVIAITHLPQIASKGEQHLKVYKKQDGTKTNTEISKLTQQERLEEIAEMLGGKQISETALKHAAELLQFKK
jgi:DNA repair protein RecN (Recombination protein N)